MKYRERPAAVEATQWFANGDHPQDYATDREIMEDGKLITKPARFFKEHEWEGAVVRYFRHPNIPGDRDCVACGKPFHVHGWIDSGGEGGQQVCPGDFVVTRGVGVYEVMKPDVFAERYTKDHG